MQQEGEEDEEILGWDDCTRVLHSMGFTSWHAFNLLDRVMQQDAAISLSNLIESVNEVVVLAASRNDAALLRLMFREDVLERDSYSKSFAALLADGAPSSPTNSQVRVAHHPPPPLKITQPVILFAIHWQRYASCQINNDFTSLGAAFEKHFPSVKLPPWLWKRACLQPTPTVEECFHFATYQKCVADAPAHWMVGDVAYTVRLEGSDAQKRAAMAGEQQSDARILDPDRIETDWICEKQNDLEYDLRSDGLDDLGVLLCNALSVHPSQCALEESSLSLQCDDKVVRLADMFPQVVFHHVTRLLADLPGVVSVDYDHVLMKWRVMYDSVRPHELLLRSCTNTFQIERASVPQ